MYKRQVATWATAAGDPVAPASGLAVTVSGPLASVTPALVDPADPPERLLLRTDAFGTGRTVVATQDGVELGRHRLRHATPGRAMHVPGAVVAGADPGGGPLGLTLA